MALRNVKNILKHCSPLNSFKLLLASALITRPRYRSFWLLLLRPFIQDGQLSFGYHCYKRVMQGTLRLSELSSDLLTVWELSVDDTYDIDDHFAPDLIVDGGGNIGLFTLRAAAAASAGHSGAKFVIVEPLPQNVERITKHLKMNGVDAEILPACLGGSRRSIPFYCREAIRSSFDSKEPYTSVIELPVLRLQDVIDSFPAERILIKLDIEGMELEALRSFIPSEHRPVYIVGELHNYEGESALMEKLFREHGWTFGFWHIYDNNARFRACSPAALPLIPSLSRPNSPQSSGLTAA